MHNLIGTELSSRYQVQSVIGEGSMGIVYKCFDLKSEQTVALKVLKYENVLKRVENAVHLKHEAATLTRLNHGGIIKVFELGAHHEINYLAMEYFRSKSLQTMIDQKHRPDPEFVFTIIENISHTLSYIHDQGICHGDIKPGNILIDESAGKSSDPPVLKLCDFGLARFSRRRENNGTTGTYHFMSPEQLGIIRAPVDRRTDLFSLGCVFYYLLTGALPFRGDTLHEYLSSLASLSPLHPSRVYPDIPAAVDTIIDRLLRKDPEQRYRSATGLHADMTDLLSGKPLTAVNCTQISRHLLYHTKLIGRTESFRSLQQSYFDASHGTGSVCFITAEAGTGKTRLLDEFSGWATTNGAQCFHSGCTHRNNQIPFYLFNDILMQYIARLSIFSDSLRNEYLSKIRTAAGECIGLLSNIDSSFKELFPDAPAIVRLNSENEHQRFISIIASVISSFADNQKPVVLFLDDLQWVDRGSMEVLFELWHRISTLPLLVVGAYRSEMVSPGHAVSIFKERAELANLPCENVTLGNWTIEETGHVIEELVSFNKSAAGICTGFVFNKTGGNQLATLEVIRQLVCSGALYWRQNRWHYNRKLLSLFDTPDALSDQILSRVNEGDPRFIELLSTAALCGKKTDIDTLLETVGFIDDDTIVTMLDKAVGDGLIIWDTRRPKMLSFTHDHIRDAFIQRLSQDRKTALHRTVGNILESRGNSPESDRLFLLVHHFYLGGVNDKCLHYTIAAGEKARKGLAISSAIHYFELAADLIDKTDKQNSTLRKKTAENLIELYPLDGKVDKAISLAGQILEETSDPLAQARLHRIMGNNLTKISCFSEAEHQFSLALKLCGKRIPSSPVLTVLHSLFQFVTNLFSNPLSKPATGYKNHDLSREIVRIYQDLSLLYIISNYLKYFWVTLTLMNYARKKIGFSPELGNAISSYGRLYISIRQIKRCRHHSNRALKINEAVNNKPGIAETCTNLGFAYTSMTDWDPAVLFLNQARQIYEAIGDRFMMVYVLNGIQNIHFLRGDAEQRFPVLTTLQSLSESIDSKYGMSVALTGFGGHYFMLGNHLLSEQFLDRAIDYTSSHKQWLLHCVAHTIKARLLINKGDLEGAARCIETAEQSECEHSLLKPVIAQRYIIDSQVHIQKYLEQKDTLQSSDLAEKRKLISGKVQRMMRVTSCWPLWDGDGMAMKAYYFSSIGKNAKALKMYSRAIARLSLRGKKFELANCCLQYAYLLRKTGNEIDFTHNLIKAFNLFRQIGSKWYCDEIKKHIRTPVTAVPTENRENTERIAALMAVSRSMSTIQNIDRLLEEILSRAVNVTGASNGVFLILDDNGSLEIRAKRSAHNESAEDFYSRSIAEEVLKKGESVITANASQQETYKTFKSVTSQNIKSVLCAPVKWQGVVTGVCYLDNPTTIGIFSAKDRELLESLMNHAAISIENARAFQEIRKHNAELVEQKNKAVQRSRELAELVSLNSSHINSFGEVRIVTQDSTMDKCIRTARKYADSVAPVLITGESGTGKEAFAHLLHHAGKRPESPFVKVNCSAIPETLFEAEFFGYERGAFTGATSSRKGKFEVAHGGTLLLDEISELPLSQQAKLLRVLEDREITPVGADTPRKIDVRVIAVTNVNLQQLIQKNKFREDLYFRIGVLQILIPPLAERSGDIPVLAEFFLSQIKSVEGGSEKTFDKPALAYLKSISYPGNVRQLRSLIYRLYIMSDKKLITVEDIQSLHNHTGVKQVHDAMVLTENTVTGSIDSLTEEVPFKNAKESFERLYLEKQLEKNGYHITKTARNIGLLPSALSRKLKTLGISINQNRES